MVADKGDARRVSTVVLWQTVWLPAEPKGVEPPDGWSVRMLRRDRSGGNRLRGVERPQALFGGTAVIRDGERFAALLARGIGRHRAFGSGMVLLSPPR